MKIATLLLNLALVRISVGISVGVNRDSSKSPSNSVSNAKKNKVTHTLEKMEMTGVDMGTSVNELQQNDFLSLVSLR